MAHESTQCARPVREQKAPWNEIARARGRKRIENRTERREILDWRGWWSQVGYINVRWVTKVKPADREREKKTSFDTTGTHTVCRTDEINKAGTAFFLLPYNSCFFFRNVQSLVFLARSLSQNNVPKPSRTKRNRRVHRVSRNKINKARMRLRSDYCQLCITRQPRRKLHLRSSWKRAVGSLKTTGEPSGVRLVEFASPFL